MSDGSEIVSVETPQGPARFYVSGSEAQQAVLILGHGAGGGVNAMDLELLARRLPERGITVLRFEQPWRTAGRKVGVPPPKLDEAWLAGVTTVGVTSGASVPEELVAAVLEWLGVHGFGDVEEVTSADEHLQFALPPELRRDMRAARAATGS